MPKLARVATLREIGAKGPGLHAVGGSAPGLCVQVAPSGSRFWVYRWQLAGQRRKLGLGSLRAVPLVEAREAAMQLYRAILAGRDPAAERRAERVSRAVGEAKGLSFRQCAEQCIASRRAGWRNAAHGAQWSATLAAYAYPVLGALPVAAIDTGLVMRCIEPIWTEKPETASRVRQRIEAVIDWATARGYRSGDNPARWRGHIETLLPSRQKVKATEHHRALPYQEVGAFVSELRRLQTVAARALEFAILTCARTSEVIGARWDEVDLKAKVWIIPANRMKSAREHRIPLSVRAMQILSEMSEIKKTDAVFPGRGATGTYTKMAFVNVLAKMNRADIVPHGFRSTFRDWAAERTHFPSEICELALAARC